MVTIIATPPDWANYGEIFADFQATTGVKINSLDPNAGSADELAAIEANKENKGPQAPDIVDVGYAYGKTGIDGGTVPGRTRSRPGTRSPIPCWACPPRTRMATGPAATTVSWPC